MSPKDCEKKIDDIVDEYENYCGNDYYYNDDAYYDELADRIADEKE